MNKPGFHTFNSPYYVFTCVAVVYFCNENVGDYTNYFTIAD